MTFSRPSLQNESLQKANVTKLTENISTLRIVTWCPSWLQFKLLIDLIFEPVFSERHRSLPVSILAKPKNSIIRTRSSNMQFLLSRRKLNNHFSTIPPFSVGEVFISSRSSTIRGVIFTRRVTSLVTLIQFRLLIKEYLTNDMNFALHWMVDADFFWAFW